MEFGTSGQNGWLPRLQPAIPLIFGQFSKQGPADVPEKVKHVINGHNIREQANVILPEPPQFRPDDQLLWGSSHINGQGHAALEYGREFPENSLEGESGSSVETNGAFRGMLIAVTTL